MFTTIIVFILVLSLLVFVHEFGHFFSARRLGVRAEEFGFGFPPRIFGVYKDKNGKWKKVWGNKKVEDNSDTIYSINGILVGGFVKIKGEDGDNKDNSDSFSSKKIWKRAIILSSGVLMNVVLASVLISIGLMIGLPRYLSDEKLPDSVIVKNEQVSIVEVMEDSPAALAGFQVSDNIMSINDTKIKTGEEVVNIIASSTEEVSIVVDRSGETKEIKVSPEIKPENNVKTIGIAFLDSATVRYPWYLAIWEGIKMTGQLLWAIVYSLFDLVRNLIVGSNVAVEVAGPVGIANLTGQMFRLGLIYLIQFTALLSLNLAIINILPFPALDGGRLLFLLIEKIKGKPVKQEIEAVFNNIGFLLLMALIIWVTLKDIIKLFN
ncbi:MAG: RIP metalloprotease RseP [Candidatus ainarchaeum sp.]|nr:RIP metalloprotease RseP [Candidatus ainarchaeum sp.]